MNLRSVIPALAVTFAVPWLALLVIPFISMRNIKPLTFDATVDGNNAVFYPKRSGRVANGAQVYAANGCYLCHSQVIRPTYAGNDLYRPDWGGLKEHPERGDTRRETNAFDFEGESYAQLGMMRIGPDLSNVGLRIESQHPVDAETWFYEHLFDPRKVPGRWQSTCPPQRFLFERRQVTGAPLRDALKADAGPGYQWIPGEHAKTLVSYLMSLKKDQAVPAALNFANPKSAAANP